MARGADTKQLTDVIQVLQMAHKTGLLLVNRDGPGKTIEQGSISFQNGQVVDASFGPYRGPEAFQRLQGWRSCYFVFQPFSQSNGPSLPSTQMPQMSPVNPNQARGYQSGPLSGNSGPLPNVGASNAPQRIRAVNEVLPYFNNLGLTRLHRQLFLLIDGQRTVVEIIRLMGHRTDEVDTLLADLERAGLIRR